MSVISYSLGLLNFEDCDIQYTDPYRLFDVLKAWRNGHDASTNCIICQNLIDFRDQNSIYEFDRNFEICCGRFYYKPTACYVPSSIALKTDGFAFGLPSLCRTIEKYGIVTDQDFLVIPDPIFWQVPFTLVLDKVIKFVTGTPMTKKTEYVLPVTKTPHFYKQVQDAPLNHGSFSKRSGGKNTFFRQIAFGKRCELSARAMIVPDAELKPNQISMPQWVAERFDLVGKWVILNRMPSLQPENFVALRVSKLWKHECFGIPLEILEQINGDFDGDECNLYFLRNPIAQAECEIILNSERNMSGPTLDLKLNPSQDMRIVYYRLHAAASPKLDFIPCKDASLQKTLRMIQDLKGSKKTFKCFDNLRKLYLREMQDEFVFGLSVRELMDLSEIAQESGYNYEKFCERIESINNPGPLLTQVFSGAKGNLYLIFLMIGSIGSKGEHSFWEGLNENEAVPHAYASFDGLQKSSNIWKPGYDYFKNANCQQSTHPDYSGRLVDGHNNLIIEKDSLNAIDTEKLMSTTSFEQLVSRIMMK